MGANTVIKDLGFLPESEWENITEKELPTVTSSDNGKVLTVQSGKWKAAEASGGTSGLVTSTATSEEQTTTTTLSASYNDVVAMVQAGVLPFHLHSGDGMLIDGLMGYDNSEGYSATFGSSIFSAETATAPLVNVDSGR